MAWFADLAGKAESLLNNLDEQTGAALRSNGPRRRNEREFFVPSENRPISPIRQSPPSRPPSLTEMRNNAPRKLLLTSKPFENDYKKEPTRRPMIMKSHPKPTYDNEPDTLVNGFTPSEYYGIRHRRSSLPTSRELIYQQNYEYAMNDVQVENTVLKNELNVLHKEVSQLLDKLRLTEDGNDVVSEQELSKATVKLKTAEQVSQQDHVDKLSLSAQFEDLKIKIHELTVTEMERRKQQCKQLEMEIELMKNRNKELEELVRQLNKEATEHESHQIKAEKDLKHAQTTIDELESNLEKTTAECRRLESDWEAYKSRVKGTLAAKDKEIKQLQQGLNLTEDTKILMEQLEVLKEEREELTELVTRMSGESREAKQHVEALEVRCDAAERVVTALRDALKDERSLKTRADAHVIALTKELQTVQLETNKAITSLHTALREKDNEISRLKEIAAHSADSSALNVADYDDQASIDNEKIHYLTQTLVQRQGKIDSLLADNNMLRIQLEKLEEREELTELVTRMSGESREAKQHVEALEVRCDAAERVVTALRDALKDERSLKTRADAHVIALTKELQTVQLETNKAITSLHTALREKDNEISRLKEIAAHSADSSALNVADYDDQASIDNEKIHYLTQTLVQRQGKIDSLLADNNMLRIQLEKLEIVVRRKHAPGL